MDKRTVFEGYVEAALFTNEWDSMSMGDFHPETRNELRKMVSDFVDAYGHLDNNFSGDTVFGHNIWYTMNGHGVGFWDGDYEHGDALTKACGDGYKVTDLYIGSDGLIYK